MKYARILALVLAVALLFTGCGGMAMENGASKDSYAGGAPELEDAGLMGSASESKTEALPQNQKLIRKVWLETETEDLDSLLEKVETRIGELGGYVEARQVYNGSKSASYRSLYGELTIRIPAEKLQEFLNTVGETSNVISTREETDDVTLSYVATESKKQALETEQTRLLELLAKAESMEDILKIESRLTEVRSQLEGIISQLRLYDNQVNYSTVYLTVTEVREYTVVQEPQTVWQRIGIGFKESWKDMCEGLEDLFVYLIIAIPYLIPVAVIAGIIVTIVLVKKNKKKKKQAPIQNSEA